ETREICGRIQISDAESISPCLCYPSGRISAVAPAFLTSKLGRHLCISRDLPTPFCRDHVMKADLRPEMQTILRLDFAMTGLPPFLPGSQLHLGDPCRN